MASQLARLTVVVALGASIGALPASAESPQGSGPARPSALYLEWLSGWSMATPGGDSWRIALDPETGTWGAAPPVDQALQTVGIAPAPLVIRHPNGLIEVIVDPSVVDYLTVRLGPDGRPVFGHGTVPATAAPSGAVDR